MGNRKLLPAPSKKVAEEEEGRSGKRTRRLECLVDVGPNVWGLISAAAQVLQLAREQQVIVAQEWL